MEAAVEADAGIFAPRRHYEAAVEADAGISVGNIGRKVEAAVDSSLREQAFFGASLDDSVWPVLREQLAGILASQFSETMRRARTDLDQELAWRREELECEFATRRNEMEKEMSAKQRMLEQRKDSVEAVAKDFEEKSSRLVAGAEALEREKRLMSRGAGMSDVFTLNVGGERHTTVQRETLCQVEGSMLATLFSGRWDSSLPRDPDGAVLIDFEAELFMPVLSYLRRRLISETEAPAVILPTPGREEEFYALAHFYGLEGCLRPVVFSSPLAAGEHSEVSDEGRRVQASDSGKRWHRVFGDCFLRPDTVALALQFHLVSFGVGKSVVLPSECGPTVGVAQASMTREQDQSTTRKEGGVWSYRPKDGMLLAKRQEDIVLPLQREQCVEGDVLTLVIHRSGCATLLKNGEDFGVVFRNLPENLKPTVEMNIAGSAVCVMP